jgi:hypothetical protein
VSSYRLRPSTNRPGYWGFVAVPLGRRAVKQLHAIVDRRGGWRSIATSNKFTLRASSSSVKRRMVRILRICRNHNDARRGSIEHRSIGENDAWDVAASQTINADVSARRSGRIRSVGNPLSSLPLIPERSCVDAASPARPEAVEGRAPALMVRRAHHERVCGRQHNCRSE